MIVRFCYRKEEGSKTNRRKAKGTEKCYRKTVNDQIHGPTTEQTNTAAGCSTDINKTLMLLMSACVSVH